MLGHEVSRLIITHLNWFDVCAISFGSNEGRAQRSSKGWATLSGMPHVFPRVQARSRFSSQIRKKVVAATVVGDYGD